MERAVRVPAGEATLDGDLTVPDQVRGVIAFAHGTGSGRHSPRNREVAAALQSAGLATLLLDLLTPAEEQVDLRTTEHRFDITLLAGRLREAVTWLAGSSETGGLPVGLFGASTGAAAALVAAAEEPDRVHAVVSRGGRPDLAGDPALRAVRAPTLFVVGELDEVVFGLNRTAARQLQAEHRIDVVPGATHLFEEPGALREVSRLATEWFAEHLGAAPENG